MSSLHWRRGIAMILLTPALLLWAPISYVGWLAQAIAGWIRRVAKDLRGVPRAYADLWVFVWTGRDPAQERAERGIADKHWRRQRTGGDRG